MSNILSIAVYIADRRSTLRKLRKILIEKFKATQYTIIRRSNTPKTHEKNPDP